MWLQSAVASPANEAANIDLSSTDYTNTAVPEGFKLYVGGTGDVKVDMEKTGTGITFTAVNVGQFCPILVTKVYKTGTTATHLVALW